MVKTLYMEVERWAQLVKSLPCKDVKLFSDPHHPVNITSGDIFLKSLYWVDKTGGFWGLDRWPV